VLAIAEALRDEVKALTAAGAERIQLNDPIIVKGAHPALVAKALTTIVEGVSAETGVYTWFGSAQTVLPALLDTPLDVIGLDFVSGVANWDAIAKGFTKKLGFGIVDGRNTRLESQDQIADAVKRINDIVPTDRVYVNPSCGLEYLPRETAFDKLKNMVEGARRAEGVPA
jgi:5-methyltetrahydropteroyltriglutamate--homocysteine methyltransferase